METKEKMAPEKDAKKKQDNQGDSNSQKSGNNPQTPSSGRREDGKEEPVAQKGRTGADRNYGGSVTDTEEREDQQSEDDKEEAGTDVTGKKQGSDMDGTSGKNKSKQTSK